MEQVIIAKPRIIGLISDTHGLLREEAVAALAGSDLIIHAGDVGNPEILERLRAQGFEHPLSTTTFGVIESESPDDTHSH